MFIININRFPNRGRYKFVCMFFLNNNFLLRKLILIISFLLEGIFSMVSYKFGSDYERRYKIFEKNFLHRAYQFA